MKKLNKDVKRSVQVKTILLTIIMIGVLGLITYGAFFTFVYQENTNVITSDCFSSSFTDGNNSIALTNALPMTNDEGLKLEPYTFTVSNTCNLNSEYYIVLNVKNGSFNSSYISTSLDGAYPTVLSSHTINTKYGLESGYGTSYIIGTGKLINGNSATHSVRVFINESAQYTSGMAWEGQVKVISFVNTGSLKTLAALNLTDKVNDGTPDFNTTATTDEGLFAQEDDYGTSYYFRGAVENNYVKFAGFYWRIIRINGDGSLRIIYDGTIGYNNGTVSYNRIAGSSLFNSTHNDNAFVGYMYGLAGTITDANRCLMLEDETVVDKVDLFTTEFECQNNGGKWTTTAYDATHANVKSSTIKENLDNWYKTNILDKGYNSAVSDTLFCNDRSLASGTGTGTTTSYYNGYYRMISNKTPNLKCKQKNDAFTVNDKEKGNADLTYPVGLITADEASFAGAKYYLENISSNNTKYYLYKGQLYWTSTPSVNNSVQSGNITIYPTGDLYTYIVNGSSVGMVPVINLTSDYCQKLKGSGTATDPFIAS